MRGVPGLHVPGVLQSGQVMMADDRRAFAALGPVAARGIAGCLGERIAMRISALPPAEIGTVAFAHAGHEERHVRLLRLHGRHRGEQHCCIDSQKSHLSSSLVDQVYSSCRNSAGSTATALRYTEKCRCAPVLRPVAPTLPMTLPADTGCATVVSMVSR